MNLVILAAGKSSRVFKKIKTHKALIKIDKKTLIEKIIDDAFFHKIKKVFVVVGFYKKKIKENLKNKNVIFIDNKLFNNSDMLYSMLLGLKYSKDDTIFCYSDIYFNKNIFTLFYKNKNNIFLPVLKNWKEVWKMRNKNYYKDAETLNFNKKGKLLEIGNKIQHIKSVKGQYMGIFFIKKKVVNKIIYFYKKLKSNKYMHITTFLNLISTFFFIKCKVINDFWYEFDDYEDIRNFIKFRKFYNEK
jgi:choline kinase